MRLSQVYVENLPYEALIARFDRPHTFFYLDPPYWGCEGYYGKGIFGREDFGKLRDVLTGLKGKFIMSINDVPEIKKLFKGFVIEEVKTTYMGDRTGKKKRVKELLVRNFKVKKVK